MPQRGQFKASATARSKQQRAYNGSALQKKRRAERNAARRKLEKQGKVHSFDGKDVDHTNHDTTSMAHLRVVSKHTNRADNQYDKRKYKKANRKKS